MHEKYYSTSFSRVLISLLINGSHLQANCNKQGFNIKLKSPTNEYILLRFGLVANNENECSTCDSWIGFGAKYHGCNKHVQMACGNRVVCATAAGHAVVEKPAFGYILVQ
jgi:hypothetical protein